MNYFVVGLL